MAAIVGEKSETFRTEALHEVGYTLEMLDLNSIALVVPADFCARFIC